jgi:hypothetical protein
MGVKGLRSVDVYLYPVPSLRMNGATPPLSYPFIPHTGAFSPLLITLIHSEFPKNLENMSQVYILRYFTAVY